MLNAALNRTLAEEISQFYSDPLGFVKYSYPWGEPDGPLEKYPGPDEWQTEFLKGFGVEIKKRNFNGKDPVEPIRMTVSKGHGVGGTTLAAWIVNFIMSTRPNAIGSISANTFKQLNTKTWAAIKRWTDLSITKHWFRVTDDKIVSLVRPNAWYCSAQSSKEANSEAFQGQHAADSTSFYVLDEASAIPDKIFEVSEGGLTDGEPMIFVFGNCTRLKGSFYRINFGSEQKRWNHRTIDSRQAAMSNKKLFEEWIKDRGLDSDFVRVRVLGLPPRAGDAQFIDMERIERAQHRKPIVLEDEPLVCGVDFAWGGKDDNVVAFRRGADARSIPWITIPGEKTRDPEVMTNKLSDVLTRSYDVGGGRSMKVAAMFLDSAGIAGPVGARLRAAGFQNVFDINFGADSPDPHYAYMRDYIWGMMKEWLLTGCIEDDPFGQDSELKTDLMSPGTIPDRLQRVKLESKDDMIARGEDSPDHGDALALTFARKVAPQAPSATAPAVKRPFG